MSTIEQTLKAEQLMKESIQNVREVGALLRDTDTLTLSLNAELLHQLGQGLTTGADNLDTLVELLSHS